ncbi:hypothetical protein [Acidiphilium sp.]|uniref:hypothetical protein n=1 Tax=Acidiphilium sp. TaxID=527 RepID=UPI003CFE3657
MRVGDIVSGEFIKLPRLERIKHTHVPHGQGDGCFRLALEQANRLPAGRIVMFRNATLEPHRGA